MWGFERGLVALTVCVSAPDVAGHEDDEDDKEVTQMVMRPVSGRGRGW